MSDPGAVDVLREDSPMSTMTGDGDVGGRDNVDDDSNDNALEYGDITVVAEVLEENEEELEAQAQQLEHDKQLLELEIQRKEETLRANAAHARVLVDPVRCCGYHWATFTLSFVCCSSTIIGLYFGIEALVWAHFRSVDYTGDDNYDDEGDDGVQLSREAFHEYLWNLVSPISGEAMLQNDTSPQGRAVDWLILRNEYRGASMYTLLELYGLLVLAFTTTDASLKQPQWIPQDPFGEYIYFLDHCTWNDGEKDNEFDGVRCNSSNSNSVTYLQLENMRLQGSIPVEIQLLSNLETLNLQNNLLYGAIPSQIGLLKNLTVLQLDRNNFTSIPTELATLSSLQYLDVSYNSMTDGFNLDPILCHPPSEGNSLSSSNSSFLYSAISFLAADCLPEYNALNNGTPATSAVVCTCCTVCCNMTQCERNDPPVS